MLLCFCTKGSEDIPHINCFYFYFAPILRSHSSLQQMFWKPFVSSSLSHTPHRFSPGSPVPSLLGDSAGGRASCRLCAVPPCWRDVSGRPLDLVSQAKFCPVGCEPLCVPPGPHLLPHTWDPDGHWKSPVRMSGWGPCGVRRPPSPFPPPDFQEQDTHLCYTLRSPSKY